MPLAQLPSALAFLIVLPFFFGTGMAVPVAIATVMVSLLAYKVVFDKIMKDNEKIEKLISGLFERL